MGRNGVVSLRPPRNEVSGIQGFNIYLDYCSWDFLGSFKILFEQSIAAIKGYRGGNTINMGLWYPKDTGFELSAFSDSDYAGCLDSRKSTSGGIQFLSGDKLVSWSSKKQDCTSMSSAEAEYASLSA
nr:retrotransposon protein, putative, unclassified [Tanacetum cinerariifolium]